MTLAHEDELTPQTGQNGAGTGPLPAAAPAAKFPVAAPGRVSEVAAARHREVMELLARPAQAALRDADFVHDLRVASRRLGEVARLMGVRDFLDKSTAKAVEASLRALRRSMGDLRDNDVMREHLLKWHMPAPVKHIAGELAGSLEADRPKLAEAAAIQMHSPSVTGAMVVLARVLEDCGKPEAAAETERELRAGVESQMKKREKQLRQAFGKAARKQTAAALHEARIAAKKLRYVMELADEAQTMRGAKQKVKFLKQVQELLGDHHDTHVIVERVQAHLKDRREKPLRGLQPAWKKWHTATGRLQAKRAAEFFARSYVWMNG